MFKLFVSDRNTRFKAMSPARKKTTVQYSICLFGTWPFQDLILNWIV